MRDPDYKIKIWPEAGNAGGYKDVPFDFEDPRGREPLVSLTKAGLAGESFYARTDGRNWPYNARIEGSLKDLWARQSVAEKLLRVNEALLPFDVELFVWDAYRPIETQLGLWRFFEAEAERRMPEASAAQKRDFILTFVSDPTRFDPKDPTSWPVHSCGGAVDLTLRKIGGKLVEMGARFDEPSEASASDFFERLCRNGTIAEDDEALNNRRLLHEAMESEGFVNYPLEYWHFDWGDQMYVRHLAARGHEGPKAAWYGTVAPPDEDA